MRYRLPGAAARRATRAPPHERTRGLNEGLCTPLNALVRALLKQQGASVVEGAERAVLAHKLRILCE